MGSRRDFLKSLGMVPVALVGLATLSVPKESNWTHFTKEWDDKSGTMSFWIDGHKLDGKNKFPLTLKRRNSNGKVYD